MLVGSDVAGWLGEVHPHVLDAFDCEAPVVAFELSLAVLVRSARSERPFVDVPRFPAVELDVALVVPEDVTSERVSRQSSPQAASCSNLRGCSTCTVARACRRVASRWPSR